MRNLILVLAVLALPVGIQAYRDDRAKEERAAELSRQAQSQAFASASAANALIRGIERSVAAIAANPALRRMRPAECRAYLASAGRATGVALALLGPQGDLVCRSEGRLAADRIEQRLFERARSVPVFAAPIAGEGDRALHFAAPLAAQFAEPGSRSAGAVLAALPAASIADVLPKPGNGSMLMVFDAEGTLVAALPGVQAVGTRLPEAWMVLRQAQAGTMRLEGPFDNVPRIVGYSGSAAGPLQAALGISRDERADALAGSAAALVAGGMLFALIVSWVWMRYRVQRQVASLHRTVQHWLSGDTAARTGFAGESEFQRLGRSFDRIADSLQERERERLAHEEELRKSRDEAVRANLSKSRFIAVANHDLRQPLHSIGMAISLLEMRHKGAEQDMVDLARLKRAVQSLETLLDALLDISDLESGLIRPKRSDFDLESVMRPVCEVFEEPARRKAVALSVRECHIPVRSDPQLLGRMLRNLMSNAVKFTNPDGRVEIVCTVGTDTVRVEIRDTGIGMSPERLAHIFEPFQGEKSSRDRSPGHGLGLAIVERVSKLLEHPVEVESQPGKGSVFRIEIPRARAPRASAPRASAPALSGRVLLVEDDALAAETTAALLRAWGAQVQIASSGAEVLQGIRSRKQTFDVVMADYRLPDMSGKDVVVAARGAWPRARTVVITGDAVNAELQAMEAAGTGLLQKPVGAQALLDAVSGARKPA